MKKIVHDLENAITQNNYFELQRVRTPIWNYVKLACLSFMRMNCDAQISKIFEVPLLHHKIPILKLLTKNFFFQSLSLLGSVGTVESLSLSILKCVWIIFLSMTFLQFLKMLQKCGQMQYLPIIAQIWYNGWTVKMLIELLVLMLKQVIFCFLSFLYLNEQNSTWKSNCD